MDRYATIMYDVETGDHQLYDVWTGKGAEVAAVIQALRETRPGYRGIVVDVNALIAESGITPDELAALRR